MKMRIYLCLLLALLLALWILSKARSETVEFPYGSIAKANSTAQSPAVKSAPATDLQALSAKTSSLLQAKDPEVRGSFDSPEERAVLQKHILDLENYIDTDRARAEFERQGFDTMENAEKALSLIEESYSYPLDAEAVSSRVLALHFISRSQFLSKGNCLHTLEQWNEQYQQNPRQEIKQALLWDVLALSKICIAKDEAALRQFQTTKVQNKTFQAQMDLAFAYQAEQTQDVH